MTPRKLETRAFRVRTTAEDPRIVRHVDAVVLHLPYADYMCVSDADDVVFQAEGVARQELEGLLGPPRRRP